MKNRVLNEIKKYRGNSSKYFHVFTLASDDIVHVGFTKNLYGCISAYRSALDSKYQTRPTKKFLQNARAKNKQWDTFNLTIIKEWNYCPTDKEISVAKKIAKENIKNG